MAACHVGSRIKSQKWWAQLLLPELGHCSWEVGFAWRTEAYHAHKQWLQQKHCPGMVLGSEWTGPFLARDSHSIHCIKAKFLWFRAMKRCEYKLPKAARCGQEIILLLRVSFCAWEDQSMLDKTKQNEWTNSNPVFLRQGGLQVG
jgi:hypothetical protein